MRRCECAEVGDRVPGAMRGRESGKEHGVTSVTPSFPSNSMLAGVLHPILLKID